MQLDGEGVSSSTEKAKGIVHLEWNGVKGGGRSRHGEDDEAEGFTLKLQVQSKVSTNSFVHLLG